MLLLMMKKKQGSDGHLLRALLLLGSRQQQVGKVILVQLQHVAAHAEGVLARVPVQDVEQLCDAPRRQTCCIVNAAQSDGA